jgi:hypothetical protein
MFGIHSLFDGLGYFFHPFAMYGSGFGSGFFNQQEKEKEKP